MLYVLSSFYFLKNENKLRKECFLNLQEITYSHLFNKRGGWNKRGGGAKVAKSLNVEAGIKVEGGDFLEKTST